MPSRSIKKVAIDLPHAGLSYNPSLEAHQDLLRAAYEIELQREVEASKQQELKEKMEALKRLTVEDAGEDGLDPSKKFKGMRIDVPDDATPNFDFADEETTNFVPVKKASVRKTKSEKAKAARSRAEVCMFSKSSQSLYIEPLRF